MNFELIHSDWVLLVYPFKISFILTPNLIFFNLMEYCQNRSRQAVRPNGPYRSDFSIVIKQNMHVSDDWYYTTDCRDVRENTTRYLFMFLFLKNTWIQFKTLKNHHNISSLWQSKVTMG